ncbi:MAG: hypothetical protein A3G81_20975 [Betaproteobacteria bacterium RIFCSPLOWO2_12_FULL_65_14]|nr:MAG: hypothetical protein A3G81_20975 [Betaproteobacteria bacterium RIFCSPLOWO2_12_FULL_65_14]
MAKLPPAQILAEIDDVLRTMPPLYTYSNSDTEHLTVSDQLLALLIEADHRFALAIGPCVQFQHIVHAPSIFRGQIANAPHQLAPGFEEVFLAAGGYSRG